MKSVIEALETIFTYPWKPGIEEVDIWHVLGRVLAKEVTADRDLPPFERVAMDGIAIKFSDFQKGTSAFKKSGIALAGIPPLTLREPGTAIEVMTGAVLPQGADAVVRYEDVKVLADTFHVQQSELKPFQHVHRQGSDARRGEVLLPIGCRITPSEVPLLASVGQSKVAVQTLPSVALVSTGDELVAVDQQPLPHQIRSSNVHALVAGLSDFGIHPSVHHLGDQDVDLQRNLEQIINGSDLIILTGGVSKGKLDWVPQALEKAGIQKHFHQVAQRPGKPLWFGTGSGKIVFALPGNPVSVFLCLYKYIRPWLRHSLGAQQIPTQAVLSKDFTSDLPLTLFLQVKCLQQDGVVTAYPVPGGGSGDFANLRHIDGFLEIPPNAGVCSAGRAFPFIPVR